MDWIVQLAIASIPASIGFLGIWASNRVEKDVARGPEWKSYADTLVEDMKEQRAIVDKLELRVRVLEEELASRTTKYLTALRYLQELVALLRRLFRGDQGVKIPEPPAAIADDLK